MPHLLVFIKKLMCHLPIHHIMINGKLLYYAYNTFSRQNIIKLINTIFEIRRKKRL